MNQEKQNYVITQDTIGIQDKIGNFPQKIANDYFESVVDIFRQNLQPVEKIEIRAYPEDDINQALEKKIIKKLSQDDDCICVCLDRCLLTQFETDPKYQDRFFRFGISRKADGVKIPRQGFSDFRIQLEKIASQIPDIEKRRIILADDGLFTGGTIKAAKKLLEQIGVKDENIESVGFIGDLEPVANLMDWIDLRDVSFLGGRVISISKSNRIALSEPYIYPWSDGESASLDNQNLFGISLNLIRAQKELALNWENILGRKITFKDLINRGLPLPYSRKRNIPINIKFNVTDYLDRCSQIVESEATRQVMIFDMDGTLYQLDGKNNGYSGSTLESTVNQNIINFICQKEDISTNQAIEIFKQAISDPVGASQFLSNRYQISRKDYFNNVWNINPKNIVKDYQKSIETILNIPPQVKLILLSSSPMIWINQVISYLGIKDKFETIYSGEDFKFKKEIFQKISRLYLPQNITSIGDQQDTDIQPAADLGFKTLLIKKPTDISLISY